MEMAFINALSSMKNVFSADSSIYLLDNDDCYTDSGSSTYRLICEDRIVHQGSAKIEEIILERGLIANVFFVNLLEHSRSIEKSSKHPASELWRKMEDCNPLQYDEDKFPDQKLVNCLRTEIEVKWHFYKYICSCELKSCEDQLDERNHLNRNNVETIAFIGTSSGRLYWNINLNIVETIAWNWNIVRAIEWNWNIVKTIALNWNIVRAIKRNLKIDEINLNSGENSVQEIRLTVNKFWNPGLERMCVFIYALKCVKIAFEKAFFA